MLTFIQFLQEETIYPMHSLGIPRNQMPQILPTDTPYFLEFLKDHGIHQHKEVVKASSLKPTQKEINGDK